MFPSSYYSLPALLVISPSCDMLYCIVSYLLALF